jgi:primosomal protein N' (replication factor Y)
MNGWKCGNKFCEILKSTDSNRSEVSIILPFADLGFVIVDEEHEQTFKQIDPAPRYHARDAAVVLASFIKAKVLLGSATPVLKPIF